MENKRKMKNQMKGITLIALVVTIVILLILAGVSINLVLGQNGLIQRAQEAKEESEKASEIEKIEFALQSLKIDEELENTEKEISADEIKNQLIKDGEKNNNIDAYEENGKIIIKYNNSGNIYTIDSSGNVEYKYYTEINIVPDSLGIVPTLTEGMKPVKYDKSTNTWIEANPEIKGDWFDYSESEKKWANVQTDNGMFVFIPRFAYKIVSGYHETRADSGDIEIVFLNSDNTLKDKNISEIVGEIKTQNDINSAQQGIEINATTNYIIHPAFESFGNVNGLWVAKYEMSMIKEIEGIWQEVITTDKSIGDVKIDYNIKMVSEKGLHSWRNITVNNIFENCYYMNRDLDSHMMKNTEWGAVSYLTSSKYGKNGEIEQNVTYITGQGKNGYTNNASTTGNQYGIFDMSGGAFEYVAAYLDDVCLHEGGEHYELTKSLVEAEERYKDVYQVFQSENEYVQCYLNNKMKIGDAMWEISSAVGGSYAWYEDYVDYTGVRGAVHYPIVGRGGNFATSGNKAGIFCMSSGKGASDDRGFRVVLVTY